MFRAKGLVPVQKLPEIPKDWDYEKSVTYMKPKISNWKIETFEIAQELYIAKGVLSAPGRRTDLLQRCSRLPTLCYRGTRFASTRGFKIQS